MEKIHADLGDTDSIVFDLRFNEGGFSSVSLKLLSHFGLTTKNRTKS